MCNEWYSNSLNPTNLDECTMNVCDRERESLHILYMLTQVSNPPTTHHEISVYVSDWIKKKKKRWTCQMDMSLPPCVNCNSVALWQV